MFNFTDSIMKGRIVTDYYALFLFFGITIAVGTASSVLKERKRLKVKNSYFSTVMEAEEFYAKMQGKKQKSFSYGTVIFVPEKTEVDFGPAVWPPVFHKKDSSPRVLFVSTWTTGKLALPGGRANNKVRIHTMSYTNRYTSHIILFFDIDTERAINQPSTR